MMERSFSVDDLIAPLWGFGSTQSVHDLLKRIPSQSGGFGSNGDLSNLQLAAPHLFQRSEKDTFFQTSEGVHAGLEARDGARESNSLPRVASLEFLRTLLPGNTQNQNQPPTPNSREKGKLGRAGENFYQGAHIPHCEGGHIRFS